MKVSVIGNCQIAALNPILTMMDPEIQITNFPAVHTMGEDHRDYIEGDLKAADLIFSQPIGTEYPMDFIRTTTLKSLYPSKMILWPVAYFSGYAPDWDVLRDIHTQNYPGPLLSYHSTKIIRAFFQGKSCEDALQFFLNPTDFDATRYRDAAAVSLNNLRVREADIDVKISEYIEQNYRQRRLFHVMNHPNIAVMAEVARQLLAVAGRSVEHIPDHLFTDHDLISAWHPENAFCRLDSGMVFPASTLARGANIFRSSDSPTGFKVGSPRVYSARELVSTFYQYYEQNKKLLMEHDRVKQALA